MNVPLLIGLADRAGGCSRPADRAPRPAGALVDLSHDYSDQTVFWPTAESFKLEKVADGVTQQGYYYAANNFATSEHGGTHIDAPVHFAKDLLGRSDPARSAGRRRDRGRRHGVGRDQPDYRVTTATSRRGNDPNGEIPPAAIVLIRTGYSTFWPDAARYLGTAERGEAPSRSCTFPGCTRMPRAGLPRRGTSRPSASTRRASTTGSRRCTIAPILYERDIPAFENLTNLDRLPARGAFIVALPMKIKGGTGAPLGRSRCFRTGDWRLGDLETWRVNSPTHEFTKSPIFCVGSIASHASAPPA